MSIELSLNAAKGDDRTELQQKGQRLPQKPNPGEVVADEFAKSLAGKPVKDQLTQIVRALAVTDVANARVVREKASTPNTWAPITDKKERDLFDAKVKERSGFLKMADLARKNGQAVGATEELIRNQLAGILKAQLKAMASSNSSTFKLDGDAALKLLKSEAARK